MFADYVNNLIFNSFLKLTLTRFGEGRRVDEGEPELEKTPLLQFGDDVT